MAKIEERTEFIDNTSEKIMRTIEGNVKIWKNNVIKETSFGS